MTAKLDPGRASAVHPTVQNDIEIRPLQSNADYGECVELQKRIWGETFSEQVPLAILKVGQRIGGVTAGAFDRAGRMVGFVFGLTGVENGSLVHWSDMLAVVPEYRDHGVGRRLKDYQRTRLVGLGVERMYWTFDPLVARNAHLNLAVLGASVVEYVVDMYGAETSSGLHRGVGTDRLLVAWPLTEPEPAEREDAVRSGIDESPILRATDGGPAYDPTAIHDDGTVRLVIEIPPDIEAVQDRSVPLATDWRVASRRAFQSALEAGWRVEAFRRRSGAGPGGYLFSRSRRES